MNNVLRGKFLFRNLVALSAFLMLTNSVSLAQESNDTSDSEIPTEIKNEIRIEEIIVTAEQTFFRLNTQIELATKRLYSVYNELNEVEEFDVNCRKSDWTDTHIQEQVC